LDGKELVQFVMMDG